MSRLIDGVGEILAFSSPSELTANAGEIREHLQEVVASPTFQRSHRSQEFLKYVVEKALDGHCDDLKERSLGMALFGRSSTYDTGEDAIVRVTASDVRRRLLQYYGETGSQSKVRIELPPGAYTPGFSRVLPAAGHLAHPDDGVRVLAAAVPAQPRRISRVWLAACAVAAVIALLGVALLVWRHVTPLSARRVAPWPDLLLGERPVQLIVCDTNIAIMEELLGTQMSLSEYANREYVQHPEILSPDMRNAFKSLGGMDYSAATAFGDVRISLRITELAQSCARHVEARSARMLQLRDFKTDDNFILLGSPRSNPWTALFADQMSFDFEFDPVKKIEIIRNQHPRPGEFAAYVPTAKGGGTGQAFAVLAFLGNPNQKGHVLIIAGTSAEGTDAAARLITNLELFSSTLRRCGVDPASPGQHFEALLRLTAMAGAPKNFEIIAFHRIPDTPAR